MSRTKRVKLCEEEEGQQLLPNLPDHLAYLCLSQVPARVLFSVCHSWRRLLYSPSFPPFLSVYALLSSSSSSLAADEERAENETHLGFSSYDPISGAWHPLPSPAPDPRLGLILLRHPSFFNRRLPIQSVSLSGHLLLLAATTHQLLPALPRPVIFSPVSNQWRLGPLMSTGRRWCATGVASGNVYVASGMGAEYNSQVARSAERWDLNKPHWEEVAQLKDGKFSREAVEAVGCRGKLCMVNVNGNAAKEGAIYNVGKDQWEKMPRGMLGGWKGPAASMEEEALYVVDEAEGTLKVYKWETDEWRTVMESEHFKGASQMTASGGKLCAVRAGGAGITVVDVVAQPPRIWVVEPPSGTRVVAVHVLPRMSRPDTQD
ncbi:F-box/kelch-repeat protein SKIP25-like [Aristolochia californica]|uniref:F-box/kelch-repeat protein SKIP25-like n=1 Tax=Aristolochia californica TaxID=171875 RepID=UPI0035E22B69